MNVVVRIFVEIHRGGIPCGGGRLRIGSPIQQITEIVLAPEGAYLRP